MAYKIMTAQAAFVSEIVDGLPVAAAMQVGCGLWLDCCPLCGGVHVLLANAVPGDIFEPCCTLPRTHPAAYQRWLELHPEIAGCTQVRLVGKCEGRGDSLKLVDMVVFLP